MDEAKSASNGCLQWAGFLLLAGGYVLWQGLNEILEYEDAAAGSSGPSWISGVVSIKGINWGLSVVEMQAELEGRGYTCESSEEVTLSCQSGNSKIAIYGFNLMTPTSGSYIGFNCNALNLCGMSLEEAAQATADALGIDLEWEHIPPISRYGMGWDSYMGVDAAGQKISIIDFLGDGRSDVKLYKHLFGAPEPSFD